MFDHVPDSAALGRKSRAFDRRAWQRPPVCDDRGVGGTVLQIEAFVAFVVVVAPALEITAFGGEPVLAVAARGRIGFTIGRGAREVVERLAGNDPEIERRVGNARRTLNRPPSPSIGSRERGEGGRCAFAMRGCFFEDWKPRDLMGLADLR